MTKLKTSAQIISDLFSQNQKSVTKAINSIRKSANIEYMPELFKLLKTTNEDAIKNMVFNLICDVKTDSAVNFYIDALENNSDNEIKKMLVSACWQSGIDFYDYLNVFIDIVLNDSLDIAIEAFTVIENNKNCFDTFENKKPLISELLNFLNNSL